MALGSYCCFSPAQNTRRSVKMLLMSVFYSQVIAHSVSYQSESREWIPWREFERDRLSESINPKRKFYFEHNGIVNCLHGTMHVNKFALFSSYSVVISEIASGLMIGLNRASPIFARMGIPFSNGKFWKSKPLRFEILFRREWLQV
jgi:hypothetical protein